MAVNRSRGRDVHIYDAKDRVTLLGGLILTNGVTKANFHSMVEIFLLFESPFSIQFETTATLETNDDSLSREKYATLERNDEPLSPGNYYVVGLFTVNNELVLTRAYSLDTGSRIQSFREEVRKRDKGCVITGKIALNAYRGMWTGYHAAHIFPLAYQDHWNQHNFDRWITISSANEEKINSKQNGLLLRTDIHQFFDGYDLSINPDNNYKVVYFSHDGDDIAGRFLNRFCNDLDKPSDELLRWHFRQAVLANMRGAGEPIFEHDFPPGSDMLGEIREGPKAAERMEFELFSRFALSNWRT